MSDLSNTIDEKALLETKLHIKLTNNGMLIYGEWSNDKLLRLLKDKLMQRNKIESLSVCDEQCNASLKSLHSIIHNGIYNECILLELEGKGMSPHNIMKAMKYGLLSLTPEELKYFEIFGAEMKNIDIWLKKLDEKLIWNLILTRLTENQCWSIVLHGLVSQDESVLYRLLLSGIDVPGILNWPGKFKSVTPTIISFLKILGIDEDTLHYVEENGINDEVENMLIDLGYNEYKDKKALEVTEEILCECNLTILESHSISLKEKTASIASDNSSLKIIKSCSCSLNQVTPASSISIPINKQYNLATYTCTCYLNLLPTEQDNEIPSRNDYLRQNVMGPLSWAISRTLRYQPSDPNHYIAYQLLRWRYGNVPQKEVYNVQQFVASATIIMDQRLVEKHKREEEDAIRSLNEAALKDICDVCLERQKLFRIKECCWKYIRVPILASATNKFCKKE